MRLPSTGGAGGGARCCRYAVLGALFFCIQCILSVYVGQKTTRTRHATHPPAVPMVEGGVEGGGGGDLAHGPLDGRTNRGSNPRRRRAPAKGVVVVTPREKPQFRDVAPTLQDLPRQLTQANSAVETEWLAKTCQNNTSPRRAYGTAICT